MKSKKPRRPKKKIRIRFLNKPLEQSIPQVLRILLTHYLALSQEKNLCKLSFVVDGPLPASLNHNKWRKTGISKKTGKAYAFDVLKPEVGQFREACAAAIGSKKAHWRPTGVTAAIILFESPEWLTQEFCVRAQDADNKVKPTLDAAALATDVPDELHWQLHVFKVASRTTRTVVYLFDLGDVVDYHQ